MRVREGFSLPPAHPRVSGENGLPAYLDQYWEGSSPRERGKPRVNHLYASIMGLIPA